MKNKHLLTAGLLAFAATGLLLYLLRRQRYQRQLLALEEAALDAPTEYHHSIHEIMAAAKEQQKRAKRVLKQPGRGHNDPAFS